MQTLQTMQPLFLEHMQNTTADQSRSEQIYMSKVSEVMGNPKCPQHLCDFRILPKP
jgi:hypothetical protein